MICSEHVGYVRDACDSVCVYNLHINICIYMHTHIYKYIYICKCKIRSLSSCSQMNCVDVGHGGIHTYICMYNHAHTYTYMDACMCYLPVAAPCTCCLTVPIIFSLCKVCAAMLSLNAVPPPGITSAF